MTRVYIAGPMTGLPKYNVPAFHAKAAELRAAGYEVENPADIGIHPGWTWRDYMRAAITKLITCDEVHFLPNWKASKGARLENQIAKCLHLRRVMPYVKSEHL